MTDFNSDKGSVMIMVMFQPSVFGHSVRGVADRDKRGGFLLAEVKGVHSRECPYRRIGKKHGPCSCGAVELFEGWYERQVLGEREGGAN